MNIFGKASKQIKFPEHFSKFSEQIKKTKIEKRKREKPKKTERRKSHKNEKAETHK